MNYVGFEVIHFALGAFSTIVLPSTAQLTYVGLDHPYLNLYVRLLGFPYISACITAYNQYYGHQNFVFSVILAMLCLTYHFGLEILSIPSPIDKKYMDLFSIHIKQLKVIRLCLCCIPIFALGKFATEATDKTTAATWFLFYLITFYNDFTFHKFHKERVLDTGFRCLMCLFWALAVMDKLPI